MYNSILKEITLEYDRLRTNEEKKQMIRKRQVYEKVPAIKKIDEEIFQVGLDMSKNIIGNPSNAKNNARKAQEQIEKLRMEKAFLMTESNIPLDYMDLKYNCENCKDKGYLDSGDQCLCLRQKLVSRAYEMSNLDSVLSRENFQTFDINIFSDEEFEEFEEVEEFEEDEELGND